MLTNVMNWIDCIIILLLICGVLAGVRIGFVLLLSVIVGFFGGMFLGGWIFPHLLPIHNRTTLTIVNGNLVFLLAAYLGVRGYDVGRHFHLSLGKGKLRILESALSVIVSTASILVTTWLIAAAIGRLPFVDFSNSTNDSYIVQHLDQHLPAVPAVFAEFDRLVNPNSSPHLIVHYKLQALSSVTSLPGNLQAVATQASASIVRITSFGCGGVISGTGFVIAPNLIATNAHVIAGVRRPIIKYNNHSYQGTPILFDQNTDFAVLRTQSLTAPSLTLATRISHAQTNVAVLGYPGGNYTVSSGVILDSFIVSGQNIYGLGSVNRQIYEIQAKVAPGSSGGPMVLSDGTVVGIVFAKSDANSSDAYALTSLSLQKKIIQSETSVRRVNTGVCLKM